MSVFVCSIDFHVFLTIFVGQNSGKTSDTLCGVLAWFSLDSFISSRVKQQATTDPFAKSDLGMEADTVLHQQGYRPLQQGPQSLQHGQAHLGHALAAQGGLDLTGLDDNDPVFHQHSFQSPHPFDRNHGHGQLHMPNDGPHTPQQHVNGQYGMLTAGPIQHSAINRLQEEDIFGAAPDGGDQKSNGHLSTKIVVDPANLAEWRQKLFNVDEMITLSEDE